MSAYALIRQAIIARKIVRAEYKGYVRLLCPHILGIKNDREKALFYQFGGYSSSGLDPDGSKKNWRCCFVEELSSVSLQDGAWHTAPHNTRPQGCVDEIDVEVP